MFSISDSILTQIKFYRPVEEKVANLLGETNIFNGKAIENKNGIISIDLNHVKLKARGNFKPETEVKVFARPENIILNSYESDSQNVFKGRIVRILPRGLFMKVEVDAGIKITAFVTRMTVEKMQFMEGKTIFAGIEMASVHVVGK